MEDLVFESESIIISSEFSSSRNPQPQTIEQGECRIFELLNDEYSMPTRRIVIRNRECPQDFISYYKTPDISNCSLSSIAQDTC